MCYYFYTDKVNKEQLEYCKSPDRFSMSIEIVLFPYVLRILQCIRQGITAKKYFNTPYFYNTLKYLSSALAIVSSYLVNTVDEKLLGLWIFSALLTTLYSYFWDIKMDWNMFETLRNKKNRYSRHFYYICAILNFILRFAWVMTICHGVNDYICTRMEVFKFFIYFAEIFRRYIWAYLRMEKEHIYGNF